MLISIIIVNWNRVDDMIETLDSLQNQTYSNYEIVVVDNGSNDGSIEVFESNQQAPLTWKAILEVCTIGLNVRLFGQVTLIFLLLNF